jgi:tetratricopeptide (TPR) repeat protein
MTRAHFLILCVLVALGGAAYFFFGPTPAERLAALLDERRWQEAELLARDILEDAPAETHPDIYRALAKALGRQGEHADAIDVYQAAYALWPTDHELRRRAAMEIVNLGRQLDARGDAEAALARHREAVALAPEIPHGHHALVASLRARGEVDEAIAALKAGLEHGPNDAQLRLQLAWLLAAHPDPAHRNADRAIALANDAFMHDRTPETLETMAVALAARGDFAGAIRHELDAIELAGGEDAPEFEARRARLESFKARQPYVESPRSQR